MRWPWQRREQETAPRPALPARRDDTARVSPMGWAFLPPLQRQLGDMPLVARTASFPSHLPAWQNPSFTGTLAHRVSTDAPSGVIDGDGGGTGEPTVHSASPDLTLLAPAPVRPPPVQRAVAPASSSEDGSRAVHAPLTTAAPTGLPVLAVQSYEAPEDPPTDVPPEAVTDVPDGEVPSETGQPTGESSAPAAVPEPSTATPPPPTPTVQRSTDAAAPGGTAASPLMPSSPLRARTSVGGRRLGLGAPLPALPLASDAPPVQRSADLPPALGSEGADGYVEVDIPSRPSRPDEPTATAEAAAEPDVPTLGPATPRPEEGLDAARTPDTATSAPPAMPVAPVQRSLADTGDTTTPEHFEAPAQESPASADATAPVEPAGSHGAVSQTAESHTEPEPVHDVPAWATTDRLAEGRAPLPTAGSVQDRPVLAQRSIATPADSVPTSTPRPGPGQTTASDVTTAARELRHTGGHPAASAGGPHLQRLVVGPSAGPPAGLTLQRSIDPPAAPASQGRTAPGSVSSDDHGPVGSAPAPDRPPPVDVAAEFDAHTEAANPSVPSLLIAATRPMLSTAAPLTSVGTAPVQRAEDTTDVRGLPESHWSPPTVTRTPGPASSTTASAPQLRSVGHPVQLLSLHGAAVGGHLQRSVAVGHGSLARPSRPSTMSPTPGSTGSPAPQLETGSPLLPLAAPSVGDEPSVQTSLVEDPAEDPAAVPAESAAVPAGPRAAGSSASTPASTGADAAGGAAGASSPEQLEALAGRLFAPLMRRIRSEMLLDRERRGLRTDSW